mmetsp:Transcript_90300/g.258399  ORF Transcript_90300/g.258399 Transcript_90300/m.258399 type:complete len:310 (+) Transcript_90300:1260-2189(+)
MYVVHLARELDPGETGVGDLPPRNHELLVVDVELDLRPHELAVPADGRQEVARDHVEETPTLAHLCLRASAHRRDRGVIAHVHSLARLIQAVAQQFLRVLAPMRVAGLHLDCTSQIEVRRIGVRLCPGIGHPTTQVKTLRHVHGLLRTDAQPGTCHLEHSHGVEGLWSGCPVLLRCDLQDLGHGAPHRHDLLEGRGHGEVEDLPALPLQMQVPATLRDLDVDRVEGLRLEACDLVVPLHAEPQRWRLAWAVRDQVRVQVAVLPLEVLRLESREGASQLQIDLLPGVHGPRLVLVRRAQGKHRLLQVNGR